jgi:hypothetical protein
MTLMPLAVVDSWLARSGSSTEVLRWFCGTRGTVVIEERADRIVASAFTVRHGEVVRFERFDALPEALAAAALTDDDEVIHRS